MKILDRVKKVAVAGTVIPKPMSSQGYVVVGWSISRGEEALVYRIPTKTGAGKASTKRVPSSVFEGADAVLAATGEITHSWFATAFPKVYADGAFFASRFVDSEVSWGQNRYWVFVRGQ